MRGKGLSPWDVPEGERPWARERSDPEVLDPGGPGEDLVHTGDGDVAAPGDGSLGEGGGLEKEGGFGGAGTELDGTMFGDTHDRVLLLGGFENIL